jgi:ABC-type dipeptide/oligopeptide/nickel transport system permease component
MFISTLPAVFAMSFGSIAGYARFTRAELTEVLTSEFMLLARTKGLTKSQATVRHALRNSMVPIFPSIVGEFVSVLSGSLVIEKIFSIPGVGNLYLNAIFQRDYDVFMIDSIFYTFISLLANILVDISYGFIDPRIRMGEK